MNNFLRILMIGSHIRYICLHIYTILFSTLRIERRDRVERASVARQIFCAWGGLRTSRVQHQPGGSAITRFAQTWSEHDVLQVHNACNTWTSHIAVTAAVTTTATTTRRTGTAGPDRDKSQVGGSCQAAQHLLFFLPSWTGRTRFEGPKRIRLSTRQSTLLFLLFFVSSFIWLIFPSLFIWPEGPPLPPPCGWTAGAAFFLHHLPSHYYY